ncbi:hypothetical protein [Rhodococcus sp. (in: high G+C Gram-positive bacteria)]|uniref:hypothetical protein n=1 Tax=Rhodococcus sp. TaxID=1831 RepID=UPI0025807682|nr:hypothetical protein [Rhodococcus sp. (in: high G+C Gram-positive bacteria)]MBQ7807012.1 hypothetical protein [Rhodococcus sp. (in: high G+C Gram-positive bacteria)]
MNREDPIEVLTSKGSTREQAEAFIDLMGSVFKRRVPVTNASTSVPRCEHHQGEFRCSRREHETGEHELAIGDIVMVWPAGPVQERVATEVGEHAVLAKRLAGFGISPPFAEAIASSLLKDYRRKAQMP